MTKIKKTILGCWIWSNWTCLERLEVLIAIWFFKGCRMGRSDKVSLWYVALLINTRFRFFIFE